MNIYFDNLKAAKKSYKKKKAKFAVTIAEEGRSKYYVKKLKYLLKEKYPFLKEERLGLREKAVKAAKPGDVIVFGFGKKYDYTTVNGDAFNEDPKIGENVNLIALEDGFDLVKEAVKRYVHKNYPSEVPAKKCKKRQCCMPYYSPNSRIVEVSTRPVAPIRVVSPCRKVVVAKAPRPRKSSWNVQVNNTYVLLTNGSRYETVRIRKECGRESVVIDGTRYTVRRSASGKGMLV